MEKWNEYLYRCASSYIMFQELSTVLFGLAFMPFIVPICSTNISLTPQQSYTHTYCYVLSLLYYNCGSIFEWLAFSQVADRHFVSGQIWYKLEQQRLITACIK